jgi:predicted kinase
LPTFARHPPPLTGRRRLQDGRAAALDRLAALLSERDAARPHLVVADDTMHLRSMRLQARRLARAAGAAAAVLHAACPLETALARNAARAPPARVPEAVARRLAAAFEALDAREGAAVVEVCTAGGVDAAEAWRRVRAAWGGPEPASPDGGAEAARRGAARGATAASAAHAADLAARRAVGAGLARLAALPAPARAAAAAELAAARRRHLDALRAGGGDAQLASFAAECAAAAARYLANHS